MALRQALDELVTQLAVSRDRERRSRTTDLVERLSRPSAEFLQPELETLLERYVSDEDSVGRDQVAHVLGAACGPAALPALLRALAAEANDWEMTEIVVLELFSLYRDDALAQIMACLESDDPDVRRTGLWGLSVIDWSQKDEYIALIVKAGSDADPHVRSEAMSSLGSVFGVGHPHALAAVTAGTRDPDPMVRRSAVGALGSWQGELTTELLVACADDTDRWVRFQVAWSLAMPLDTAAQAALERLAADTDPDVRSAARQVLALNSQPE